MKNQCEDFSKKKNCWCHSWYTGGTNLCVSKPQRYVCVCGCIIHESQNMDVHQQMTLLYDPA